MNQRQGEFVTPAESFIRQCKKRKFKSKLGDSTGQELKGGELLTRSLILRDLLRKHVLADNEKCVGVLIPPSNGGVIVNMALALDKRTTVNLNYTLSSKLMNECIKQSGIKHILTSKKVLSKFDFELEAKVFCLEDLKDKVTTGMKMKAAWRSFVMPGGMLANRLGLNQLKEDDLITIVFTSGSTGTPKGVMLTQQNVASNVEAIGQVINLTPNDTMVGILPFFHSFGYTVTMWSPMALNMRGVFHFNPLEATQIAKLVKRFKATVFLATPTFLRSYIRRCSREDFETLDTVVAGAEKLPVELCDTFENRFGVRPVEGYGATELSPLVSVNIPPSRSKGNFQIDCKEGTIGRTIPHVVAKITDLDDDTKELGPDQSGMLWIKGPNVMRGYLHREDLTKDVIVDGWYRTGDVGIIDTDGFIKLTGRISRFSKIGGEMIPHIQIEDSLIQILGDEEAEAPQIAVTAVPDARKGERLIVLHTKIGKTPDELCKELKALGLPNIYIPTVDSFVMVDEIPILGSGKFDLKSIKDVAMQRFGPKQ